MPLLSCYEHITAVNGKWGSDYISAFATLDKGYTNTYDSAEVLADAWRRGPADRSWSLSCMIVSRSS